MAESPWRGDERRSKNETLELIKTMREWLDDHREEIDARHNVLLNRLEEMSRSTLSVIQQQNRTISEIHALFKASFPDGDGQAHRKAHEDWMAKAEADKEFWLDIKKKVVGWAMVAVLGWGGIALWAAFIKGPA